MFVWVYNKDAAYIMWQLSSISKHTIPDHKTGKLFKHQSWAIKLYRLICITLNHGLFFFMKREAHKSGVEIKSVCADNGIFKAVNFRLEI